MIDWKREPSGLLTRRSLLIAAPAVILANAVDAQVGPLPGMGPVAFLSQCATAAISGAVGTNIGDETANGGLAAAFDGNTNKASAACANKIPGTGGYGYVGKNYSNPTRMAKVDIYSSNNSGFSANGAVSCTINVRYKSSAPAAGSDGTVDGTATFTDANSLQHITITCSDVITTATYWFVQLLPGGPNPDAFIGQVIFTGC